MTVQLFIAPAAAGKTAYVLNLVQEMARGLALTPRVVVPSQLQVRSWRRRLARGEGAIGVRVMTFDRLYAECLNAAGEVYTELSAPVQYRLLRAVIDQLPLAHYAPLIGRPGFIQLLQGLIGELKAGMIFPDDFAAAVTSPIPDPGGGPEPRLGELAQIYTVYQARLQDRNWADRAGLGWLAVEALAERAREVSRDWPLLVVDGFDNLTPMQLELLQILAGRAARTIITLTGTAGAGERVLAHRRFDRTRLRLQEALGTPAEPLPVFASHHVPLLAHLEANLFDGGGTSRVRETSRVRGDGGGGGGDGDDDDDDDDTSRVRGTSRVKDTPRVRGGTSRAGDTVELVEAPGREGEVRAALRWLKARLVHDGMRPGEVALLARSLPPYRPLVLQTAAEFGLPIRLVDGLPLRTNPAVAALLDLLRLMLPGAPGNSGPRLPRRPVVEAWRSPYFDWSALPDKSAAEPIGISPVDADALDVVARWGRVIGGLGQWEEALAALAHAEERGRPANLPAGPAARELEGKFLRFVRRLEPPVGKQIYRDFVRWLEALIGPDADPAKPVVAGVAAEAKGLAGGSLQMVARARSAAGESAERDVAALQALKDVLRGLVWAEEALGASPVDYTRFFDELAGAVEAATYLLPARPEREDILVADVVRARGLPFRAVAVLGLAEGEFPSTLTEDPLLRDADRQRLRDESGLYLEPSTASAETEFFYEAVTRPSERLLLTRPRLADNGALWQASPFWEEVRRLVAVEPERPAGEHLPSPDQVASWPELMESLAAHAGYGALRDWVQQQQPERQAALDTAVRLFRLRGRPLGFGWKHIPEPEHLGLPRVPEPGRVGSDGPFDGDLSSLAAQFAARFGPDRPWSASRLEAYRSCPFHFFVGSVLGLEPREEPVEGLDARQLGNIYHRIFESLYQAPEVVPDPADLAQLLAALETVAGAVLDDAPAREGFRATAWWAQTRQEIVENVRRSLEALAELPGDFEPYRHEQVFGLRGRPLLVVREGEHEDEGDDSFRLRGFIDRLDRSPDGRLRVIDYKTGGPHPFTNQAVEQGKKLQLPLYALAARDALGLGEPVEGFYWHVRHAEPSGFTLAGFPGGAEEALAVAVAKAWEAVRGARSGYFVPHPPGDGCPSYCPAAAFCWHCRPGFRG